MLDYPPGYEIDGNTITPGGISAVMAVTRPRGCRPWCRLRCCLRCCPRCRQGRGTRAGSGGRRTGRGARSSAGATVRRRERTPFRPYVKTVGPALEGRRGRTAYGPCAGIRSSPVRSGPVRCGGGVVASRVAATARQAGRQAGGTRRGGSGAFRRETAGPGRAAGARDALSGRLEPAARETTGARSGGAVALPSPRPAVAGSPSAPARRLGPQRLARPPPSAAPAALSRARPQPRPPTVASVRSRLSPQPASTAAARPRS